MLFRTRIISDNAMINLHICGIRCLNIIVLLMVIKEQHYSTIVYLVINGYSMKTYTEELYDTCINIASGNMTPCQISMYLVKNTMQDKEYNVNEINDISNLLYSLKKMIVLFLYWRN